MYWPRGTFIANQKKGNDVIVTDYMMRFVCKKNYY